MGVAYVQDQKAPIIEIQGHGPVGIAGNHQAGVVATAKMSLPFCSMAIVGSVINALSEPSLCRLPPHSASSAKTKSLPARCRVEVPDDLVHRLSWTEWAIPTNFPAGAQIPLCLSLEVL